MTNAAWCHQILWIKICLLLSTKVLILNNFSRCLDNLTICFLSSITLPRLLPKVIPRPHLKTHLICLNNWVEQMLSYLALSLELLLQELLKPLGKWVTCHLQLLLIKLSHSSLKNSKMLCLEFRVYLDLISCLFLKMLQILSMSKASLLMLQKEKSLVILLFVINLLDIFRPFPGFKSVRLIHREKKPGEKVILCFADFENPF